MERIHHCIRLLLGYSESSSSISSLFEDQNHDFDGSNNLALSNMTVWELIKTHSDEHSLLRPVANRLDAALGVLRQHNFEKARTSVEKAKESLSNLLVTGQADSSGAPNGETMGEIPLEVKFCIIRLQVFCSLYLNDFFSLEAIAATLGETGEDRESMLRRDSISISRESMTRESLVRSSFISTSQLPMTTSSSSSPNQNQSLTQVQSLPHQRCALEAIHREFRELLDQVNTWSDIQQAIHVEFAGSLRPVYRLASYKRHRQYVLHELASLKVTVIEIIQSRPPPYTRILNTNLSSSLSLKRSSSQSVHASQSHPRSQFNVVSRSRSTSPVPMRSATAGQQQQQHTHSNTHSSQSRAGAHIQQPSSSNSTIQPLPRLTYSWKDDQQKEVELSSLEPQKVTVCAQVINAMFTTCQHLFVGTFDHILAIYDLNSLTLVKTLPTEQSNIDCFTFCAKTGRLFVGLANGKILVIDAAIGTGQESGPIGGSLEIVRILTDHTWSIRSMKILYASQLAVAANSSGSGGFMVRDNVSVTGSSVRSGGWGGGLAGGDEGSMDDTASVASFATTGTAATTLTTTQPVPITVDRLISVSLDKTIRVYDILSLECLAILKRYGENDNFSDIAIALVPPTVCSGPVSIESSSFQTVQHRLFAGLSNGGIAMWDLNPVTSYQYLGTFFDDSLSSSSSSASSGTANGESSPGSSNTGSSSKGDSSSSSGKASTSSAGNTASYIVMMCLYANQWLFTATYDGYIKIWDTYSVQCVHMFRLGGPFDNTIITEHAVSIERPAVMKVYQHRLWIGCESGRIQAFDAITWNVVLNITNAHSQRITGLVVSGDKLCTTAMDSTIRITNMETPVKAVTIQCDKAVLTLAVANGRLYSGGRTIRGCLL